MRDKNVFILIQKIHLSDNCQHFVPKLATKRDNIEATKRDHIEATKRDHIEATKRDHIEATKRDHI